jgi:hypothetical protein
VLYSVYENGTDDHGSNLDGQIIDSEWATEETEDAWRDGGDLVIRVPAPAFELPPAPTVNH